MIFVLWYMTGLLTVLWYSYARVGLKVSELPIVAMASCLGPILTIILLWYYIADNYSDAVIIPRPEKEEDVDKH